MTAISGPALAGKVLAEWRGLGRALTRVGTTRTALTDATHDLRVYSRRTREAFRWARLTCPRIRGLKSFLRQVRSAAGPFRDADVIGHRLQEYLPAKPTAGWGVLIGVWAAEREHALDRWLKQAAQLPEVYKQLNKEVASWAKAAAKTTPLDPERVAAVLAKRRAGFLRHLSTHSKSHPGWHQLRIEVKGLRYEEETAPVAMADQRLKLLQTHLGNWHDGRLVSDWLERIAQASWVRVAPAGLDAKPTVQACRAAVKASDRRDVRAVKAQFAAIAAEIRKSQSQ